MKIILLSFCVFLAQAISAQNFDYSPSSYDFDPSSLNQPMMDSVGYNSCVQFNRIYEEIYANQSGVFEIRLIHSLRQINNISGVETYNKISIPLYQFQEIVNFKLRIIKDGKVISESTKDQFKTIEEEGVKYRILAIDNVSVGCYIETIIAFTESVEYDGTEILQYQSPAKESMVCLIVPKTVHFKTKIYNADYTPKDTVVNERRFIISQMQNISGNKSEPYYLYDRHAIRLEYTIDYVENGNFKGNKWGDIGTSYYDKNFKNYHLAKSGLKKFIKELKLDSYKTTQEKVFAIEDYIKRNIAEVSNQPTPDDITDIIKTKYGSVYSIIRLYMQTFREAGINFEIVGTCERSDCAFDKSFETENFFKHVLFFFPETNAYLDPEAMTDRSPIISDEYLGQDGMRIKTIEIGGEIRPVTTIKNIPANDPEKSKVVEKYTVNFQSDLTGTETNYFKSYSGFATYGFRAIAYYFSEEDRKKTFTELLQQNQTNTKVDKLEFRNRDLGSFTEYNSPFEVTAVMTGPDLLEYAGDKVIFKIGEVIGAQSELYNEEKRQHDIETEFNHMYERDITVIQPEGYELSGLESLKMNFECKNSEGKVVAQFHSDYTVDGNKILIHIVERYDAIYMPIELYDPFSSVINAAADFNKITLLLKKK